MKRIICCSGGKDSVATLILAIQNKIKIDLVLFAEVMYDLDRNISAENPIHMKFIHETLIPYCENNGIKFEIVRSEKMDYLKHFNHIIENPRKHIDHKGKKYGFALPGFCSIKRECKMKPMMKRLKELGEVIQYVGIAIDEPKRLESLHKTNNISLLEQFEHTEEMARDLCLEHGLLSFSYEFSKRGGCWVCPWAKVEEHAYIRKHDPKLWKEFCELENEENLANCKWNVYAETLAEREEYIKNKEQQMTIFDFLAEPNERK